MKCKVCGKKAVYDGLCKEHFIEYFENKVKETIERFKLFNKNDKIVVAVSGGKDSLVTLYLLKKFGYNVNALAIDEGIKGYREYTLKDLKDFVRKYDIPLKIVSFKEEIGYTLDEMTKKLNLIPCSICGVFRRWLLNKYAQDYDVIATGHNMDDEVQSIMMNLLRYQLPILARIGPKTGIKERIGFVPRVKPLYLVTEKEVRLYALLKGFKIKFVECPYARESFRNHVIDFVNSFDDARKIKENIIDFHVKRLERLREHYLNVELKKCKICHMPSQRDVCKACELRMRLENET